MPENKLNQGDKTAIARAANCHVKSVEFILEGKRGKRQTAFQKGILAAIKLRQAQNIELEEFCKALAGKRELEVLLKKSKRG